MMETSPAVNQPETAQKSALEIREFREDAT